MHKILTILLCCICSVCSAQHIVIGKSFNISGTTNLSGFLAEDMSNYDNATLKSYFVTRNAEPDVDNRLSGANVDTSDSGEYAAMTYVSAPRLATYKWDATDKRYEMTNAPDTIPPALCSKPVISGDGQFMAVPFHTTGATQRFYAYKWDAVDARYEMVSTPLTDGNNTFACALSYNGSKLAVANGKILRTYTWNGSLYAVDNAADTEAATDIYNIAMSADGTMIACGAYGAPGITSYKWDTADERYEITTTPDVTPVIGVDGNEMAPPAVSLSADGNTLVATFFISNVRTALVYKWSGTQYVRLQNIVSTKPAVISADGKNIACSLTSIYRLNGDKYALLPGLSMTFTGSSGSVAICDTILAIAQTSTLSPNFVSWSLYINGFNQIVKTVNPLITGSGARAYGYTTSKGFRGDASGMKSIWSLPFLDFLASGSSIIDYNLTAGRSVTIPAAISGVNIVSIGAYAFDNDRLTSLTLPEGLVTISEYAFRNNSDLTNDTFASLALPTTLTTIGQFAFYRTNITGALDLKNVTSVGAQAFTSFNADAKITELIMGNDVTLAASAFGNQPIIKVTLGTGCTIDLVAFLHSGLDTAYASGGAGVYNWSAGWTKE